MRGFLIVILISWSALGSAQQDYWICVNADGVRAAQDHPCGAGQQTIKAPVAAEREAPPKERRPRDAQRIQSSPGPASRPSTFGPLIDAAWKWAILIGAILVAIAAVAVLLRRRVQRPVDPEPMAAPTPAGPGKWSPKPDDLIPFPTSLPAVDTDPPIGWTMDFLATLEKKALEALCERYWQMRDCEARRTPASPNRQVDIVIEEPSDSGKAAVVIQCSTSKKPIGVEAVRALWSAREQFSAERAALYAISGFSDDAVQWTLGKQMELITGDELLLQVFALPNDQRDELLAHVSREGSSRVVR
jgi:hypothetical protein